MEISFLALRLKVIFRLLALYFNLKSKFIFALTSLKERNITLRYIITSIGSFCCKAKKFWRSENPCRFATNVGLYFLLYTPVRRLLKAGFSLVSARAIPHTGHRTAFA